MSELLEQFLVESRELVQAAADDLLALESAPGDPARLDGAFRAVHTLKGSVALFDLAPMGAALHAGEDLLDALRRGAVAPDRAAMDALLALLGASEAWLDAFAADGRLPDAAAADGRALEAALRARLPGNAPAQPAPLPAASPDWLPALLEREAAAIAPARAEGRTLAALRYVPSPDCFFLGDDPIAIIRALPAPVALHLAQREPWPADGPDPFTCNLVIEAVFAASEAELRQGLRLVADQVALAPVPAPAAPPAPSSSSRGLRVDAARVDALVDLAEELVVARNGLAHLVARVGEENPALARALAESEAGIGRLAERMHRAALGLRLVPLGRAFARLPRLARETAGGLGKEIALSVAGEAVEADRAVVDGLFDPLLHLLRNAIDHGIEPPEVREAAGKPRAGRIALSAAREDGWIAVTLSDDGRGMDPARLRAAAKARGVADDAAIDAMDDAAALDLVFRPGFSTAGTVTAISGRGVGMDAARAAVDSLGGRVAIRSAPGEGTTIRLLLPAGAAVTGVLTVRAGGELYGIPVDAVAETARLPASAILPLGAGEAFVLRGRTLPLLRLAGLLGLKPAPRGGTARLLVTGGAERAALEVEGFGGRLDVLLRPPQGLLRGLPGLAGTALLGDGSALLVLDLPDLLARGGAA
ncbi:chemotaxis protein CheA [Roseomonas populi]|uniref:histidine kinase n=1 Tax=Roseomonas populi TaxID=3121582 RepID=A0ABT1X066_9PROT|nr:chemotaxis protein CheW [Roseomonas pecuniae]MCR0981495.1 chemotaxis protein CheW [Roseomonas pecuniae]